MQVRFGKRLGSNGDSLVLTVTREARMLKLDKGDLVSVVLGDPSPEAARIEEFSKLIYNKNSEFFNIVPLNPADLNDGATTVLDFMQDIPISERNKIQSALEVFQDTFRTAMEITKNGISSDFAYYSDAQKSFIQKFMNVPPEDGEYYNILQLYFTLQIASKLLTKYGAFNSQLERVSDLYDSINKAVDELMRVSGMIDNTVSRNELINKINEDFRSEMASKSTVKSWFVLLMNGYFVDDQEEVVYVDDYNYVAIEGISKESLVKDYSNIYDDDGEYAYRPSVFGPFTEAQSKKYVSYLQVQSEIEAVKGVEIEKWTDNVLRKIMKF